MLSDSLVHVLATGMPHLEEFRWESTMHPRATIVALGVLSQHCNGIKFLGIPIDTVVAFPSDLEFKPFLRLQALEVANWCIDSMDDKARQRLRFALAEIAPSEMQPANWIVLPEPPPS